MSGEYNDEYYGKQWDRETYSRPWRDHDFLRAIYESDHEPTYREMASEIGCAVQTLVNHMPDGAQRGGTGLPYEDIAMFSGGYDSLVATHYSMETIDCDVVLHIDTGTGLDANLEYVKRVCDYFEWPLEIISPETTLEEFAREYGFPKAHSHSWIYRYLKEHPLSRFKTSLEASKPTFYTGVRKAESKRRMETVSSERQSEPHGRWWWDAPIADYSDKDVAEYIVEHGLPRSSVVETIGRSGECFCGAYSDRVSELVLLEDAYPAHYEWLQSLEADVQEAIGDSEDHCYWGVSGLTDSERESLVNDEEYETDMQMCVDCENGGHRNIGVESNPSYETVYLAGPYEDDGFRSYASNYDQTVSWVDPFELNDFATEKAAREHAGSVYQQDMNALTQSDVCLLRRIDGYNLCGASMEAVIAVESVGIPVIVYNDADSPVPTMLQAVASEITDSRLDAVRNALTYARTNILEQKNKTVLTM